LRSHRHVLLASAAGLAASIAIVGVPAAASAQPATSPATPTITLALSPATVDYGHQSVTASGTVTTSAGPVTGAAVTISYEDTSSQAAQISLTTGTDGSYSGTIPDPETAAQTVTATVAATASTAVASASAQLGFTQAAVTITASFATPYADAGSAETLSGVASYSSGGTSHPLANSPVSISFTESGAFSYPFSATVETAADGSFSYLTPPISLAITSGAATVSSAATPYLDAAQASATFAVNQEAQIDLFSGHLAANRALQFSACGGLPEPLADSPLVGPLEYQYSTSANGPWFTLGTGKANDYNGQCWMDTYGGTYTGKFTAPVANAYYRAYAPAVPGQMSTVSNVIHLHRYATKIGDFAITPRRVSRGGKVTVSGLLFQLNGRWRREARQLVVIEFRYKNKTYTLKHRLTTNSSGRFRGVFAVPRTAAWLAVYNGSKTEFAAASKAITVRVR
jgi:hypothetical protein